MTLGKPTFRTYRLGLLSSLFSQYLSACVHSIACPLFCSCSATFSNPSSLVSSSFHATFCTVLVFCEKQRTEIAIEIYSWKSALSHDYKSLSYKHPIRVIIETQGHVDTVQTIPPWEQFDWIRTVQG